jgi:single-stranded-DNA-specific exonuclease
MTDAPLIRQRAMMPQADSWVWPEPMHPVLRQIYSRRPIAGPADLKLRLAQLVPVSQFQTLEAGVDLLCLHRENCIVIVGDFDADGATSTAVMKRCLDGFGFGSVEFLVPDRFELGYGLTTGAVELAAERGAALIVTVDNGISSLDGVACARQLGIDVLVTDHHLPGPQLPAATAIVNPHCAGSGLDSSNLAGVGVVFYLMAALGRRLEQPNLAAQYLDLVALGTVADVVPLDRGNRILVQQGLLRIRAGKASAGVQALFNVAGKAAGQAVAADLGFHIGPRLNAAGRLDDMTHGVRCLLSDDIEAALDLAQHLDELNQQRRTIERRMSEEADELTRQLPTEQSQDAYCIYHPDWHQGVVGLVASRIKERYQRPVIAFAKAEAGKLKGSGRCIPGVHLRDSLADVQTRAPGLIEKFGGHAMAAGLTISADNLQAFSAEFEAVVVERLAGVDLDNTPISDGALASEFFTLEVAELLRSAGPWGQLFPEPVFDGEFELLQQRVVGGQHLRMQLRPADSKQSIKAIAFRHSGDYPVGCRLILTYRLDVDDYGRVPQPQLIVETIATAMPLSP